MPIEMPRGLPFSVDTFSPNSKRKRHHFLTHAHKDHCQGILTHASYPIYSTVLTKALVLQYYPQLDDGVFVGIEVGKTLVIDDPDGDFAVTAFDANHCPGAVMFLFEGRFGNILHTGDCRLTPECLQSLPEKFLGKKGKEPMCQLDYVFLDCTFGRFSLKMPSRQSAIQQVINCVWKHPDAPRVYLTCDLLGQEEILVYISQTFGCKIYVDKVQNPGCYQALELTVPEILSQDSSSRFQIFDGFPKLCERAEAKIAEARANFQHEPLVLRPSAQWYACEEGYSEAENRRKRIHDQAVRDISGVWHVCYSIHSSREELDWALQLLAPKWVVSTTPSCRAIELDYVKRHCFNARTASDNSFSKLLNITLEDSSAPETTPSLGCLPIIEIPSKDDLETQPQSMLASTSHRRLLNLSPPSKRPSVTLFGKPRAGIQDSIFKHEKETVTEDDSSQKTSEDTSLRQVEVVEVECRKSFEESREEEDRKISESTQRRKRASDSPIGSSKSFSQSLRNFYRSMNVSVPQPLPSLVELMHANKCSRRRF
ncbi:unnamed protein product [Coffea canephora]|uniref:DNA repair metallo-beta-lactamase domain-containing protein n=1 Tax=Coffea canephora TaxID=49390 RepID=A0A068U851_COFCA|nr:unnamed protein product [Coffea canephora]